MAARARNAEVVLPIVMGTIAFYLGKKATDTASHRWTVYLRHAQNLDLSHFLNKVVYTLHPSFQTPTREATNFPFFELTEHGWGEFELAAKLYFTDDASEAPVEIYHKLKLYTEAEPANPNTKKPIVAETYEEIVFNEPAEAFHSRLNTTKPAPAAATALSVHFPADSTSSALQELQNINTARQKNAQIMANLQAQLTRYS